MRTGLPRKRWVETARACGGHSESQRTRQKKCRVDIEWSCQSITLAAKLVPEPCGRMALGQAWPRGLSTGRTIQYRLCIFSDAFVATRCGHRRHARFRPNAYAVGRYARSTLRYAKRCGGATVYGFMVQQKILNLASLFMRHSHSPRFTYF